MNGPETDTSSRDKSENARRVQAAADRVVGRSALLQSSRYPTCYAWLVFLSSLDIMFTSIILCLGGSEANPLVDWVLLRSGLVGLVGYKFALIAFVIWVCEVVGRQRDGTGRRFAEWSVAITLIPVYLAMAQLLLSARAYAG